MLYRGGPRSSTVALTLLSLTLFLTNLAAFAESITGRDYRQAYLCVVPWVPALSLHLVLSFMGKRRRWVSLVAAAYCWFGALSATAILGLLLQPAREWSLSRYWIFAFLSGLVPVVAGGIGALVVHHQSVLSPREKDNTRIVLVGVSVFACLGLTEFFADLGYRVPRLGALGTLLFNAAMVLTAIRIRLIDPTSEARSRAVLWVLLTSGVLGFLAVSTLVGVNDLFVLLGSLALTTALLLAARRVFMRLGERREKLSSLATLGRFSAQMAHDLKNPLAALKGSVDFLREERRRGRSIDGQGEFLDLMYEQLERLHRVADRYQRMARVEPQRTTQPLNPVIESVLSLQSFAARGVRIRAELAADLPPISLDADLFAKVLENLIQNAFEAMAARPGEVIISTALADERHTRVEIRDNGPGMDARTAERAFDEFFTTKTTGSGLGLAFARQVVEAHGGDVALTTREGWGTVIALRLPIH